MKIGKYPVKRKYSVPRLLADLVSAVILFITVYLTFMFIEERDWIYSMAQVQNDRLDSIQYLKYLAFIPPAIAVIASVFSVVFVLVSKKAPKKYNVTAKTSQMYYIILADAVSLIRVPVLLALFEVSYYVQKLIAGEEFSVFSIQLICDILLAVIIVRFTMHRFEKLCEKRTTESSVSENPLLKEIEAKQASGNDDNPDNEAEKTEINESKKED